MKKVILVTGASSSLGTAVLNHFADCGDCVYGGVRDLKKYTSGKNITYIKLDITSDVNVKNAIKKIIKVEKRIDVLVNCVGMTLVGPTFDFTSDEYTNILNTNVIGAFRLMKEVVPHMRKKNAGKIITITSMNGLVSFPNFGLYSSSKFALDALSSAVHYELQKDGIGVTTIAPGAIYTPKIDTSKMPHKPAREKFFILKLLLPMVTQKEIVDAISSIIELPRPPLRIVLGRDAKLVHTMNRFLPLSVWSRIMSYVWSGK